MRSIFLRSFLIAAVLLPSASLLSAQTVSERNVRAQMQFLAGDAMQGRGSGTPFERIAAEYVGSQFMQFGLEPAGENGFDGKPGYVQTIPIRRKTFEQPPNVMIGRYAYLHGNEMVVLRTNAAAVAAPLQKLTSGGTAKQGHAVFVKPPEGQDQRTLMQSLNAMAAAGASIVIVEETVQLRAAWANYASRRVGFTSSSAKPFVMMAVSRDAAAAINGMDEGTNVQFGGVATEQVTYTWNAIGKLTGTDKTLGSEVVVLSSHLDHLGVRDNAPGDDKLFNGADDDASGTVAVMELARTLGAGKKPKRTVYFVCFGSEEAGGYGSGYFVDNLGFPIEKLVANLQFEMIGRPDAKVKPEELWLTGYERSNLGPELAKRGAKLVQDPHPQENFFQRSDNYTLARRGVVAHTVSSFGLHTDYHKASDELKTIDFNHMTRSITSMIKPVNWLVNSNFKPTWVEGKKP